MDWYSCDHIWSDRVSWTICGEQLAKDGSQVLVSFRGSEDSHHHLKLMVDLGQIVPMKYNPRDEKSIKAVMAKANVVINLIG
ncbi:NADH dehydrogenase [ubiquinone] 1 alpha subcomplex subunit 9, mitochondrial-like [Henckelia pumila]|uniref:NADH dehydrogenase [ubiquinone] 1 alpha subcomplex subunit 9, mitochondrial-like n=1 Tax=Henckelia pumila TaxID=405737 RepID=UPI003C6DCC5F